MITTVGSGGGVRIDGGGAYTSDDGGKRRLVGGGREGGMLEGRDCLTFWRNKERMRTNIRSSF